MFLSQYKEMKSEEEMLITEAVPEHQERECHELMTHPLFLFLFKFGTETGIWNGWGIDDE